MTIKYKKAEDFVFGFFCAYIRCDDCVCDIMLCGDENENKNTSA